MNPLVEMLERRRLLAAHVAGSSTVYNAIQDAVNAAPAGGIVTVDAGIYDQRVTIDKSLTLRGAPVSQDPVRAVGGHPPNW